jgi:hypothetical protein
MQTFESLICQLILWSFLCGGVAIALKSYPLRHCHPIFYTAIALGYWGSQSTLQPLSILCSTITFGLLLGYLPEWFATLRDGKI